MRSFWNVLPSSQHVIGILVGSILFANDKLNST